MFPFVQKGGLFVYELICMGEGISMIYMTIYRTEERKWRKKALHLHIYTSNLNTMFVKLKCLLIHIEILFYSCSLRQA